MKKLLLYPFLAIFYVPYFALTALYYVIHFVHFITIGMWKRMIVCSTEGHDWRFMGGSFVWDPPHSFECKYCKKKAKSIPEKIVKL